MMIKEAVDSRDAITIRGENWTHKAYIHAYKWIHLIVNLIDIDSTGLING
jgi:hypothetical protein